MQERLTKVRLEQWAASDDLESPLALAGAELLEARELIEQLARAMNGRMDSPDTLSTSISIKRLAFYYLASIGRLEIESDDGVRVVGRLRT